MRFTRAYDKALLKNTYRAKPRGSISANVLRAAEIGEDLVMRFRNIHTKNQYDLILIPCFNVDDQSANMRDFFTSVRYCIHPAP